MAHASDKFWMRKALREARKGWGRTSPNPLVGAVIVRDDRIVGCGHHQKAGEFHAEPQALQQAGAHAKGATLYVNLEPCSTSGRTPPCTETICQHGIARVVIGTADPNPQHAGTGIQHLRERGISVITGVEEQKCRVLNEAFFCWVTQGRPFVLLKMATTLDGKIATANGQSQWITGEKSRRKVQRFRQWADAIMVGAETVRLDDPSLTVRTPRNWPCQPLKLVWTQSGRIPRENKIFQTPDNPPRLVNPRDSAEWTQMLQDLGHEQITALLIEGGGELAASGLSAGIVDKVAFFLAPKLLGGRNSRPAVGGQDPHSLADAYNLNNVQHQRSGNDFLITGYPAYVHRTD